MQSTASPHCAASVNTESIKQVIMLYTEKANCNKRKEIKCVFFIDRNLFTHRRKKFLSCITKNCWITRLIDSEEKNYFIVRK